MDGVKKYSVLVSPKAEKKMDKLDAPVRRKIAQWIKDNLVDCENPRAKGRALEGNLSNLWRYRVGNYRIIAQIRDAEVVILIVKIDKREDAYR